MASTNADKHRFNKEMYSALTRRDKRKVIDLCGIAFEGALHMVTIHNDTVLHMATYSKQFHLVSTLLSGLPDTHLDKLTRQNNNGNTILHEAATTNKALDVVEELLQKERRFLSMPNELRETAKKILEEEQRLQSMQKELGETTKKMLEEEKRLLSMRNEQGETEKILEEEQRLLSMRSELEERAEKMSEEEQRLLRMRNELGEPVEKLLEEYQRLISMRNELGETALFRAAHYGKTRIFKFLEDKISEYNEPDPEAFLRRNDNTTVLHISILAEHFDLALEIAKKYPHLINERDPAGMTSLQLLSCNPTAFKRSYEDGFKQQLINSIHSYCSLPWWKADRKYKHKNKSALKLAELLIERDTTWESTNPGIDGLQTSHRTSMGMIGETPLFLATKSGCVEIVEEILRQYPQAVEYVNNEGQNILHIAIKYRQLKIFNLVKNMKIPRRRLVRNVDIHGNSVLHMVGMKREDYEFERMQNPADKLQEELQWFERVEKVTITHLINQRNRMKQTADGLFANTNRNLHNLAKEWLKRTSEGCSIVAVLIASVTFAAAYAMPGGPDQETGFPILLYQRFFMIFIVSDISSLTFALIAVVTFLLILTSPFQIENFKKSLPKKLMLAVNFLLLSLMMMMIAFAATIILLINRKESWTKVILYAVPVGIFLLAYFPLYILLSKAYRYLRTSTETWSHYVPPVLVRWISNSFIYRQTQIGNPSNLSQSQIANSLNPMDPATSQASTSAV